MRALLALIALLLLGACGKAEPWRQESFVFGTRVEVLITGVGEPQAREAAAEVLRDFDDLHRRYHAWQPSELTTLNEAIAAGRGHDVTAEMAQFLRAAQTVAAASGQLFDPGIGRLVALWGFQRDEFEPVLPDANKLAAVVAQHPSIAQLQIENHHVSSRNRAVAIDFGGILKGIALDRAAGRLKARGIPNALINIGGNILALGDKNGTPWRIGIQHPRPDTVGGMPLASLDLRDGEAIGTSGDYHRFFELNGQRYCHLIDPRNGQPVTHTRSVTVLIPPGPDAGMRSDALSKPLFIAGESWPAMAQGLKLDAVLKVGADGTAEATPAMKERLTIEAPDIRLQVLQRPASDTMGR